MQKLAQEIERKLWRDSWLVPDLSLRFLFGFVFFGCPVNGLNPTETFTKDGKMMGLLSISHQNI